MNFALLLTVAAAILNSYGVVNACFHDVGQGNAPKSFFNADEIVQNNLRRRELLPPVQPLSIALTNVRIFNGSAILPPQTVYINGSLISRIILSNETTEPAEATINCNSSILLPGLIDAHIHPATVQNLETLTSYGVTSSIMQSCFSKPLCSSLTSHIGLSSVIYPVVPAAAPGSIHASLPGWPQNQTVSSPADADAFVWSQLNAGAHFIKIIADTPTPATNGTTANTLDQATLSALAAAARNRGHRTTCHATALSSFKMALAANVSQVHHAPLDVPVDEVAIAAFRAQGTVSAPTLVMMRAIAAAAAASVNFAAANESAALLYQNGVPILAGTDTSTSTAIPGAVHDFGSSLHEELSLLVQAGLSNVDALRAATVLPAEYFGLSDRGVVKEGMRADLILLAENPLEDIGNTRTVERIWVRGVEFVDRATGARAGNGTEVAIA